MAKKKNHKLSNRPLSRSIKLALIPHRHNDYHPHLIRHYGLAIILLLVVALQAFHFSFENNQVLGDQSSLTMAQLLEYTNSERTNSSLSPLALNSKLSLAAHEKAKDMLEQDYWSHDAPDGTPPWHWITDNDYKYIDAGENLARGFNTTSGVVAAWMESPSHRSNILNQNYTEVGFAAVNGEMGGRSTTLVVAMYARPASASVAETGEIAGAETHASQSEPQSLLAQLRRGVRSVTPSLMATLGLLGLATVVALLAHAYRKNLPLHWRKSWKRHHALCKAGVAVIIAICAILSYGGGIIA